MVCISGGIFLVIAGMLAMLPGRDTANYLQNGGPRTLKEAIAASGTVAAHSRALPSKQAFVVCKGRFYHWDTRCLLLSSAHEHSRLPVHEMTRAEAEKRGYLACGFCDRHDF
jgi:hypothetical protein